MDELPQEHIMRIDRHVMEDACLRGENILVAICLESTREATLALLEECASQFERTIRPKVILCANAWPYFERGDMDGFAGEIAYSLKIEIVKNRTFDCVVLAQALMRVAEDLLQGVGCPVISTPLIAAKRAIEIAENT